LLHWNQRHALTCWPWETQWMRRGGCVGYRTRQPINHHLSHLFRSRTYFECSTAHSEWESVTPWRLGATYNRMDSGLDDWIYFTLHVHVAP
jgi:hypothetical protein